MTNGLKTSRALTLSGGSCISDVSERHQKAGVLLIGKSQRDEVLGKYILSSHLRLSGYSYQDRQEWQSNLACLYQPWSHLSAIEHAPVHDEDPRGQAFVDWTALHPRKEKQIALWHNRDFQLQQTRGDFVVLILNTPYHP